MFGIVLVHLFPLEDFIFIFPYSFWFYLNRFDTMLIILFCIIPKLIFLSLFFLYLNINYDEILRMCHYF